MIRHWTRYEGRPNGADRGKMRVTLNWKSLILLNKAAFEAIGRPGAVELFFDTKYGMIGIKAIRPDAPNAFPVTPILRGNYRRINAAPFCYHFDIRVVKTVLFLEPVIENNGILELNLAKTIPVTRGSR